MSFDNYEDFNILDKFENDLLENIETNLFKNIENTKMKTPISLQEGLYLQRLLYSIKDMNGIIIELGSYMGNGSTMFLGSRAKDMGQKLICIDTFLGSENEPIMIELLKSYGGSSRDIFRKNSEVIGINNSLIVIQAKTTEAAEIIKDQVKFIFIDADHSYQGVSNDFNAYFPLVNIGGIICLHDCGENDESWPGPTRLYHELRENKNLQQITSKTKELTVRAFKKIGDAK